MHSWIRRASKQSRYDENAADLAKSERLLAWSSSCASSHPRNPQTRAPRLTFHVRLTPFGSYHNMHALSAPAQAALAVRPTTRAFSTRSAIPASRAVPVAHRVRTTTVAIASSSDTSPSDMSPVAVAVYACASLATALATAMPAMAEEAASAAAEIPWYAGVVDITVLGVVGVLVAQGNKKAAAGAKNGKGKKKW